MIKRTMKRLSDWWLGKLNLFSWQQEVPPGINRKERRMRQSIARRQAAHEGLRLEDRDGKND